MSPKGDDWALETRRSRSGDRLHAAPGDALGALALDAGHKPLPDVQR